MSGPATNRYQILSEIGRGGFAVVSLAQPLVGGGQVALKRPLPVFLAEERMRREIDVQREFAGPHVMPVLDADIDEPWFAMPVAEGNLFHLWRGGHLGNDPETLAVEVVAALADGLRDAHEDGLVHRDVTPANVLALVDPAMPSGRRWVVADFGLVRRPIGETTQHLTSTGTGLGTPGYAAPETWDDAHQVDRRADVYSAGRLLAWLLTDRRPLPFVPLLPSGRLRGLIASATDNDAAARPATLDALGQRLERLIAAPAASPRATLRDLLGQHRVDLEQVREVVRGNLTNERLLLDDLAPMERGLVARWTADAPSEAARVAVTMCRTLRDADWGNRNFDYANVPLGWAFAVLRELIDQDELDDAEDVGAAFFEAEQQWDRWPQLNATVDWLRRLDDTAGAVIARAIIRAGGERYYQGAMEHRSMRSTALSALLED
ncbi:serine/threonine-protein kinase [Modestobacter sp. SSW1-42]|uniref:serine/threonine-protein kinase n=1 Tax=Modestobacter sp. SSW1-42 TaxID=596372 RepID=UPI003986BA9E